MPILIKNQQEKVNIGLPRTRQALHKILELLEVEDKEVSILIVDDEGIQNINRDYLGRDRPTNVISFSMSEGEFGDVNPSILGDIIISAETAGRDAKNHTIPFDDEIDFLLIHGTLHLLGYDHETTDSDAEAMKEKEKELFFSLNKYFLD
ncbi:MAG: rRNA maturation RNase YbeY [Deltaproteobacteria bacterium]|nr:rRNA maturation RNase YbeY [Deltaproteobacteria bacterium]